jgi:cysteinyl-tRNA synthetase
VASLANDLNTPEAISKLHDLSARQDWHGLRASLRLLGLIGRNVPDWAGDSPVDADTTALIEALLVERAEARRNKDFARADQLRDGFVTAGVIIMDGAEGSTWDLTPEFDKSTLEALK